MDAEEIITIDIGAQRRSHFSMNSDSRTRRTFFPPRLSSIFFQNNRKPSNGDQPKPKQQ